MKILEQAKRFLTANTALLKSVRTLVQVLIAWAVTAFTGYLTGTALPVEVQVALVGVLSALLSAVMAEAGRALPEGGE